MTLGKQQSSILSPQVGEIIDGHRIVRPSIASGGSGIIHEVIDSHGRRCAMKVLQREKILQSLTEQKQKEGSSPEEAKRYAQEKYENYVLLFKGEFQKLIGLIHPYVARAYSFGFYEDHFYLTTEFIEGLPIATYYHHTKPVDMKLALAKAATGLDFIHKSGLLHLDIKSENILVQEINGEPHVKIIDLGLAMAPKEYKGQFFGSVHYMAPEVALGRVEEVDARADLWSFGVLFYFCTMHGRFPLPRTADEDPEVIRRIIEKESFNLSYLPSKLYARYPGEYPEYFDQIIIRLLQKNPQNRFFPTARAVVNAILSQAPEAFTDKTGLGSYLLPEGNQHIGRKKERSFLEDQVQQIILGKHPSCVFIEGKSGLGKTHFLQKLKQYASQYAEKLFIHEIHFPADPELYAKWKEQISKSITESIKPVVILLDDIQRLYQGTDHHEEMQKFCESLLRLAAERKIKPELHQKAPPLLFVATHNFQGSSLEVLLGKLHLPKEVVEKIALQPFTSQEVAEYLQKTPAFKNRELPADRVAALYHQTNGIPAELKEHLSLIDSQGLLFDLEGNILLSLPQKEQKNTAPRTEARLFEQYQQCDIDETRILKVMAVWDWKHLAPPMAYHDLTALLPDVLIKQKLNELVRREVLTLNPETNSYTFYEKNFLPSLIYRSMPIQERYQWHQKILELYQEQKKPKEFCLLHQAFLEPSPSAYRALTQLMKQRQLQGDIVLALQLAEYAFTLSSRNEKLQAHFAYLLVSYYLQAGSLQQAEALASQMHQQLASACRILQIRLALQLITIALHQQKFDQALEVLQNVKHLLRNEELTSSPTVISISVLNTEAQYYYELGRTNKNDGMASLEKARILFEQSYHLAKKLPETARNQVRTHSLGIVLSTLGDHSTAIVYLKEALKKYQGSHYTLGQMECLYFLANAHRLLAQYKEALVYAEQMRIAATQASHAMGMRLSCSMLADIYHDMDNFNLALQANDQHLAAAALQEDENGYKRSAITCWGNKGHCYKELREFDRALLHFEAMIEAAPPPMQLMWAYEGMGETYFLKQDFDKSDKYLNQAEELLNNVPEQTSEAYRFPIRLMRAQILYQRGNQDEAKKIMLQLQPLAQKQKKWSAAYAKVEKDVSDDSWLAQQKQ